MKKILLILSLFFVLETQAQTQRAFQKDVPVGTIIEIDSSCPDGWLSANAGTAISRVTYVNLFQKIGTSYGVGDGGYGTTLSCAWSVEVTKQGADYKPKSRRPSLQNQCIKY